MFLMHCSLDQSSHGKCFPPHCPLENYHMENVFQALLHRPIIIWKMINKNCSLDQFSHGKCFPCITPLTNYPCWCHQMETFSTLLAPCAGNSLVTVEFPSQRPETWSFDVFFDLLLNKQVSKQSRRRSFGMPSCPLWRHCDAQEKCSPFISPLTNYHMENVSHKLLLWPIITRKISPIHISFDQLWQGNELMYSLEGDHCFRLWLHQSGAQSLAKFMRSICWVCCGDLHKLPLWNFKGGGH